jgi:hypothetical protein
MLAQRLYRQPRHLANSHAGKNGRAIKQGGKISTGCLAVILDAQPSDSVGDPARRWPGVPFERGKQLPTVL